MNQKNKAPNLQARGLSESLSNNPKLDFSLSPREARALLALMKGPVMRERLDSVAGASNSPAIVMSLRELGLQIDCERLRVRDRDGRTCRPGRYSLAPSSRAKAESLLRSLNG